MLYIVLSIVFFPVFFCYNKYSVLREDVLYLARLT